jgi:hypothetical protein
VDRNKNISAYLQMDEEVWITREFLADLFAYHGWPTDVFPREHACAVPECRRVASAYGGPGGGFAEFCVEHNRCRFCARPTQFDKNLCGFCHNDEQHGVKREQMHLTGMPASRRAVGPSFWLNLAFLLSTQYVSRVQARVRLLGHFLL